MKNVLAVISREFRFAERFCEYINRTGCVVFTAVPFEDIPVFSEFRGEHDISVILCDEEILSEIHGENRLHGAYVVPLSGTQTGEGSVFKYQSAESILRDVMEKLPDVRFTAGIRIPGRTASVLAVYSPVSDEVKTCAAITAAEILSRERKTLYMNFEELSGLTDMLGDTGDRGLSEAFYYLKQTELTPEKIAALIRTTGMLQYIPPVHASADLTMINGNDCVELIKAVFAGSSYEMIVADLPSCLSFSSEVLSVSEAVLVPQTGEGAGIRFGAFMKDLRLSEKESVLERIRNVTVPAGLVPGKNRYGRGFPEMLLFSPLADIVTEVLCENS